jgi:hypothetical protein
VDLFRAMELIDDDVQDQEEEKYEVSKEIVVAR